MSNLTVEEMQQLYNVACKQIEELNVTLSTLAENNIKANIEIWDKQQLGVLPHPFVSFNGFSFIDTTECIRE